MISILEIINPITAYSAIIGFKNVFLKSPVFLCYPWVFAWVGLESVLFSPAYAVIAAVLAGIGVLAFFRIC